MTTKIIHGIGTIMVTIILFGTCRQLEQTDAKPENFYRIQGDFYHRIEKSDVERFLSADSGCVYAIASEAQTIPLADNPKKLIVLLVTRPTEEPDRAEPPDYELD